MIRFVQSTWFKHLDPIILPNHLIRQPRARQIDAPRDVFDVSEQWRGSKAAVWGALRKLPANGPRPAAWPDRPNRKHIGMFPGDFSPANRARAAARD
jgi:hypothetical protein